MQFFLGGGVFFLGVFFFFGGEGGICGTRHVLGDLVFAWLHRYTSSVVEVAVTASTSYLTTTQWGAADAEIKVPSGENTELKRSPFKASRSVCSYTCDAYCQGFLLCLFRSIHLHFFQNLSRFLPCWLWLTHGSCVGPQNKIGHPAGCRFPC